MHNLRSLTIGLAVAIVASLAANVADAQFVSRSLSRSYYHRSYGSGSGNSMASLIRAQGQVVAANAQATLNYEKARSQYLANQKQWAENYFKMKEERKEHDAREHEKNKLSPETQAEIAKIGLPRQLGSDALDPVTGHITWPVPLQAGDYSKQREELNQLFEQRAQTSQAEGLADKIHATTNAMTSHLRSNIEKMPAGDYMTARKFLDSLDYAAHTHAG
ncbi:MAG TPA: hypothetical protein VGM05_03925 [Planctomycetaceae bacterium]